eukprot:COSAG06_NODE_19902_length_818_cov_1.073713_2_plen_129_part_01
MQTRTPAPPHPRTHERSARAAAAAPLRVRLCMVGNSFTNRPRCCQPKRADRPAVHLRGRCIWSTVGGRFAFCFHLSRPPVPSAYELWQSATGAQYICVPVKKRQQVAARTAKVSCSHAEPAEPAAGADG